MKCCLLIETNVAASQQLKLVRQRVIDVSTILHLNFITLADKFSNKCRIYFFFNDTSYLKPAFLLQLIDLYCPLSYTILHDFENEVCFIRNSSTIYKTHYDPISIADYLPKLLTKDSLLTPTLQFYKIIVNNKIH